MRSSRLAALLLLVLAVPAHAGDSFYLKDGDRVVFYGDSITDQRLYTVFTEAYVLTRYPRMNVSFVHSGWGGDRVTGGGGGPIDVRLERDVIAYKPTVMTIMLGMNDASYRPFDQAIFDTYARGYRHIVEKVRSEVPGIRLTLIVPSPFDDATRPPSFEGGYNAVLLRYGEFVKKLAEESGAAVADLNTSVVEATRKAMTLDRQNASRLNPDRVHPGPSGQLLMAAALLHAWNAPATVSDVALDVSGGEVKVDAKNAKVSEAERKDGTLSWTQLDEALPFPLDLRDSLVALAARSSDIVPSLDAQTLKVEGLPAEQYTLEIDGSPLDDFTKEQLGRGVNLAVRPTPMLLQAAKVLRLTVEHNNVHFARWRQIQVPLQSRKSDHVEKALDALDALEAEIVADQRATAQPKPHRFRLRPKS
jgi:lysophospholipase L1-like esterase